LPFESIPARDCPALFMAKDVYWFKHECDSVLNPNLRRLQHIHTHWGKGVYWDVIEILRGQADYKMACDDIGLIMLASMIGINDPAKFTNWFNDCVSFGLLIKDGDTFYSPMLVENMRFWDAKKVAGSQGGRGNKKANQKQNESKTKANLKQNESKTKANEKLNKAEVDFAKSNNRIEQNRIEQEYISLLSIFAQVTGKAVRGDKKSISQFSARLKENYTLADFEMAIKNCFNDQYHKENPHYLTLEFITRPDKLQKYMFAKAVIKEETVNTTAPPADFFKVDFYANGKNRPENV
jgi:hypothetical protein